MGDSSVDSDERQDPQDPVELQRDTAEGDSSPPGAALSADQVSTLVRLLRVAARSGASLATSAPRTTRAVT